MGDRKFDIVLYGASGFTGAYVLEEFVKSDYSNRFRFAIAGRNENRLRKVLTDVGDLIGRDLSKIPVIIADSSNENDLVEMAKQTRLIINVVGPYRLYGEAVVKAAVENGASHVDISGEPAWLEKMQLKYSEKAKETGSYVVGASGWDSIPYNFGGTLCYAETVAQIKRGESGYIFNDGTYQTLILGLSQAASDGIGKIRRELMPEKLEKSKYRPPKRPSVWYNEQIDAYCLPFLGADKSVVQRSQYYDAVTNKKYSATVETYLAASSWLWAWLGILWMMVFSKVIMYEPLPAKGPSRDQCKQATFTYWFQGYGWPTNEPNLEEKPTRKVAVRCDGPDSGYIGTAGCVLSSAFTVLEDREQMPNNGGVYTTSSAFKNTRIFDLNMTTNRKFDIVLYGASGFTGAYALEEFVKSEYADRFKLAVAGRSEQKLKKVIDDVAKLTGRDLSKIPVIIADSSNENDLNEMAKQTRLIINVVGPYRLYGEAVVKAAVENGASHVDISGEPAWLEKMQLKYSEKAKETGSVVVGACGWDSIPVDLGIEFLRSKFPGTVAYAETFAQLHHPQGYAVNTGTYQTLLLALTGQDRVGETRRRLMPEKLNKQKTPKHSVIWYNNELQSHVIPFPGADRSVVNRSQYYETVVNKKTPIAIETYILKPSWMESALTILWFGLLSIVCKFQPILRFCQKNPELVSFGSFSSRGPRRELVKQAKFTTYIQGNGWKNVKEPQSGVEPNSKLTVRVDGPDAGYVATSGCVLSSALTVLEDKLPVGGGVYTTAVAFENTKILDRLASFNITFNVQPQSA
ncbi:Epimerase [Aphelenchoides bicaudatus]|nr:Epimerase [Aphelenchoides bicaudatus]